MDENIKNIENQENQAILFSASAYTQKYFFNELYKDLPMLVQKDLHEKMVLLNKCVGGVVMIGFYDDGEIFLRVVGADNDFEYDDIFAALNVKEFERTEREFLEQLSQWYTCVFKVKADSQKG